MLCILFCEPIMLLIIWRTHKNRHETCPTETCIEGNSIKTSACELCSRQDRNNKFAVIKFWSCMKFWFHNQNSQTADSMWIYYFANVFFYYRWGATHNQNTCIDIFWLFDFAWPVLQTFDFAQMWTPKKLWNRSFFIWFIFLFLALPLVAFMLT